MSTAASTHSSHSDVVGTGAAQIHARASILLMPGPMGVITAVAGLNRKSAVGAGPPDPDGKAVSCDAHRLPSGPSVSAFTGMPATVAPVSVPMTVVRPVTGSTWRSAPLELLPVSSRRPSARNSMPLPRVETPALATIVPAPVVVLIVIRSSLFSLHAKSVPSARNARSAMPKLPRPTDPIVVSAPLLGSTMTRFRVPAPPGAVTPYTTPVSGCCASPPSPADSVATVRSTAPVDGYNSTRAGLPDVGPLDAA